MFTVSVKEQFAAAHRLPELGEGLHGHTYAVRVSVERPGIDRQGIACDFRILKRTLRTIVEPLDHQYLNDLGIFSGKNPTAENIAVYVYEAFAQALVRDASSETERTHPLVRSVEVAESDTARVTYEKTGPKP